MGAPEGSDVGTPVGGLVGSADGLVGTDVGTPVGFVVGTPVGDSVVGTDDGAGVGSGTMTCSLRAPSSASLTNCRRRPSGALLDGLWAAAGAARQASATSAAIDRIFVGFAVSGLALDPRGVRRGLPGGYRSHLRWLRGLRAGARPTRRAARAARGWGWRTNRLAAHAAD